VNDDALAAALPHEVHVWIADPCQLPEQTLIARYLPLLDEEEAARFRRFHFNADRMHYLAAHALLRLTLSRYAPRAPQAWRFTKGPFGKPDIDPSLNTPLLRFNLSHTKDLVACVVASGQACGIDVEHVRPMNDMRGVADTVFADAELAALDATPGETQLERFFSFWTLKEAYIKATGQGMSAPLKAIAFTLDGNDIAVDIEAAIADAPAQWTFCTLRPSPQHLSAIAVQRNGARQSVVWHRFDWDQPNACAEIARQMLTS
jgi:4'-phosphopantetheinyl transferase